MEHQPQDGPDVWFSRQKDFKAAILYKGLKENMLKNFEEHILFKVWTQGLNRKIKTTKKKNKKEILEVKNKN